MLKFTSKLREGVDYYAAIRRQLPYANPVALNRTAEAVRQALFQKTLQVFDRPTPYTLNALRVARATKGNLVATIVYRDGVGKGTSADRYLEPQVLGGPPIQEVGKGAAASGVAGRHVHGAGGSCRA